MSIITSAKAPGISASSLINVPSALSTLLSTQSTPTQSSASTCLPLEVLHNLQHQHSWSEIRLHLSTFQSLTPRSAPKTALNPSISDLDLSSPSSNSSITHKPSTHPAPAPSSHEPLSPPPDTLLSGLPPKPLYIHPDLQRKLLKAGIPESTLQPELEWVLPTSLGARWTLSQICGVFDCLPARAPRNISEDGMNVTGEKISRGGKGAVVQHQDAKRVLLAMKAHDGVGGDGTVVYYIVQEGEVKPRQN